MRLPEGIVVDAKETFGNLKFSAMRRENFVQDAEGNSTGELKSRTYDLKCAAQGMMIQVSLGANVEKKTFAYDTPVELVEPRIDTVATATYGGNANTGWYIKAADIVAVSGKTSATADSTGKASGTTDAAGKLQTEQTAKKG